MPLTVYTDPLFVKRILTNLITNAIRYSQKPGSKIVLAARRLRNGRITIGVYDQGPGIASEERHRISMRFTVVKRAKLLKPAMVSDFQL